MEGRPHPDDIVLWAALKRLMDHCFEMVEECRVDPDDEDAPTWQRLAAMWQQRFEDAELQMQELQDRMWP